MHANSLTGRSVLLVIVDGFGAGPAPDSRAYNDEGADTADLLAGCGALMPWTLAAGEFRTLTPTFAGKGTTTGHWELVGAAPVELVPIHGHFPPTLTKTIAKVVGHEPLWAQYHRSGAELLDELGETSIRDGRVIAYSSEDAVLQLAASPLSTDLEALRHWGASISNRLTAVARLGRVITRPFTRVGNMYVRLASERRDFHARPSAPTALEELIKSGVSVSLAGKAVEIFHWLPGAETLPGVFDESALVDLLRRHALRSNHLLILNLREVDDLLHEGSPERAAERLTEIARAVAKISLALPPHAVSILTADHGCDIRVDATANTRECVPFLSTSSDVSATLKLRKPLRMADVAALLTDLLVVEGS